VAGFGVEVGEAARHGTVRRWVVITIVVEE
jgi:hypothetical protein